MPTANTFKNTETFIDPLSEYGMLRSASADKTVWLWASIPWSAPLLDGASDRDRRNANDELASLFDNLAKEVSISGMRYRNLLKDQYRTFHILAGSTPVNFHAKPEMRNTDLGRWQNLMYSGMKTRRQFAYVGIPLKAGGRDENSGERRPGPWQRFVTTLDRYAYSIANGAPDFEEYLPDMHRVERMMLGAGLQPFSLMDDDEFSTNVSIMKSWWMSYQQSSALPIIPESDHLHLFPDPEAAIAAEHMYEQRKPCREWNIYGELPATVCFAQSSRFNRNPITDANNLWMARLLAVSQAGGGNAIGVSIRGKVEPPEITANEIRRNSQTINDSIKERFEHNREASGDMQDLQERLDYKKSIYQHQDMPPTLIDLSVAALVAGRSRQALDALSSIPDITFVAMNTPYEQLMGFKSMCPCSPVTVIPYTLHWSSTVVSGSGVSSFERGGDDTGAMVGLSEKNRQPILVGTTTVQDNDMRPFLVIIGDTGSGKAVALSTRLPVPPQPRFPDGGTPTVEELREGDLVYGRDGKPYPILKLHPINTDDVYRVHLSDGQTIDVSGNHLWVASSFNDRNRRRRPNHIESLRRRRRLAATRDALMELAGRQPEGASMTCEELSDLIGPVMSEWWKKGNNAKRVGSVLSFMDVPYTVAVRETQCVNKKTRFPTTQNCLRYDPRSMLSALIDHYERVSKSGRRWSAAASERADVLRSHLDDEFDRGLSVADVRRMLGDQAPSETSIRPCIKGLKPISERYSAVRDNTRTVMRFKKRVYDVREACAAIGHKLLLRYESLGIADDRPYDEQVVTTRDMLEAGVRGSGSRSTWAIHAAEPVKGAPMQLPVDPWMLGMWLANGVAGTERVRITSDGIDRLRGNAERCGLGCKPSDDGDVEITGLRNRLESIGILNGGELPECYFNASVEQRLELLRGILDRNGAVGGSGVVTYRRRVDSPMSTEDMVRLLRSLGIVVHTVADMASDRRMDAVRDISFATTLPVFSDADRNAALPKRLHPRHQWLYVTGIERLSDRPHRCLTVGSPDHTFLVAGYVPTHNTMAAFNLMLQWSMIDARDGSGKTPCIFINPKSGNDLEDAVRSQGGVVMRMDSDLADGVFDPFKVMDDVERAKEMATIMIADILDPKGMDVNMELTVASMIDFGVKRGARCCGVALGLAAKAVRDRTRAGGTAADIGLPENTMDVYRKVIGAIRTYQSMRLLFGTKNDSMSLRVSNTLTLINAGKRSLIPEQDSGDTVTGRIQQWLLRMTVLGAGTAVQGRDGMVVLDEAWVAMGKGKGSSKTLEEWTRMARSKRFTPVLCTQKVQEFLDSGLTGGISRALLLSLDDPDESDGTPSPARQALRLLQVDDKSGRMKYRMSQDDTLNNGRPNVNSLKRLRVKDKKTGKEITVRGSVAYWIDGRKPPIPVEIIIPPALLKQISTTATDVIARQREQRRMLGKKN